MRVWGEMVDVLWERWDVAGSMNLEDLFDQLVFGFVDAVRRDELGSDRWIRHRVRCCHTRMKKWLVAAVAAAVVLVLPLVLLVRVQVAEAAWARSFGPIDETPLQ